MNWKLVGHLRTAAAVSGIALVLGWGAALADPVEIEVKCADGDPPVYMKRGTKVFFAKDSPEWRRAIAGPGNDYMCKSKAVKKGGKPAPASQ